MNRLNKSECTGERRKTSKIPRLDQKKQKKLKKKNSTFKKFERKYYQQVMVYGQRQTSNRMRGRQKDFGVKYGNRETQIKKLNG